MQMNYQIPRAALIWTLLAVVVSILPQAFRMPIWISLIGFLCVTWRALIFAGMLSYPGRIIRISAVVFTLLVSVSQTRNIGIGFDAAASLLTLGFVFKLIEMRKKRDIYVVLSLCFIMAMVAFLYSQTIATTLYIFAVVIVITAAMISLNRLSLMADNVGTAVLALRIVVQALPLTLVLFLLFPRIPPMWAVPIQSASAKTGISDEMSPGDISQLGRSGELAFRVQFESNVPPLHQDLYWRGLVLDDFDGETWRRTLEQISSTAQSNFQRSDDAQLRRNGNPLYYNVVLEPTQQPWIFGLHLAETTSDVLLQNRNYEIFKNGLITQRFSYDLRSFVNNNTDLQLSDRARARNTALPSEGNLRSKEFASTLRSSVNSDREYAYELLAYFQQNQFFYTLSPPLLGSDRIDNFLFDTLEGFCEHYASAFTFLMRAAGIPARVVVGYQGAEYNRFENYMMVYQYNAHAWSEIWLEGEGWVRFDPTAAVSPERVRIGMEEALGDDPAFMEDGLFSGLRRGDSDWLNSFRLRMDALEYEWSRRVINYDQDMQFKFFQSLMGEVTERKTLTLLAGLAALAIFFVAVLVIRIEPSRKHDPLNVFYRKLCHELEKIQLKRQLGEGPIAFRDRVIAARPELRGPMTEMTDIYVKLSYEGGQQQFNTELKNFKQLLVGTKRSIGSLGKLR